MSLQARMSKDDSRLYNVARDCAHNFGDIIKEVALRCENRTWPELGIFGDKNGVTEEDLGNTIEALCVFMGIQADNPKESMYSCLVRSRFIEQPMPARAMVMAYLGSVMLGCHWAGVREATLGGVGPALTYKSLRWYGRRSALLMRIPLWQRRLHDVWRRVRRSWFALWRRGE